jgi:hypothetical protein
MDVLTYLVIFEADDEHRPVVIAEVKAMGYWAELTSSVIMVTTEQPLRGMIERLHHLVGEKGSLWIVTPSGPWASYGDAIVEDEVLARIGPYTDWMPADVPWMSAGRSCED